MYQTSLTAAQPNLFAALQISGEQVTAELFALCDLFFRQASRSVHVELDQFLTDQGHSGGTGWFLDALGITARSTGLRCVAE